MQDVAGGYERCSLLKLAMKTAPTARDLPLLLLPTVLALTPSTPAVHLVVLLVVPEQPPDAVAPHQRQPSEQCEQVAEAAIMVLWSK